MVKTGQIAIYYGAGKGKTSVSLGKGIRALGENLRVVMIQFMDCLLYTSPSPRD